MKLYERLHALRVDLEPKVTQRALADALKTTQRKISRMETGEAEPSMEDLRMLCRYYNVSADYLLGLTDRQEPYPRSRKAE